VFWFGPLSVKSSLGDREGKSTMSDSLSSDQVPQGICSDYSDSRSTAHSIEESIQSSENGQRISGMRLASRACHVGNLALLLGGNITGDRVFIRM
jgi:hypothetical protein